MVKNKYANWDREARESTLERDYKEICRNIFHNEQLKKRFQNPDFVKASEAKHEGRSSLDEIVTCDKWIAEQRGELTFLEEVIDEYYAKKKN